MSNEQNNVADAPKQDVFAQLFPNHRAQRQPQPGTDDGQPAQQPTDLGSTSGLSPGRKIQIFRGLKTDTVGAIIERSGLEIRQMLTEAGEYPSKGDCPMFTAGIFPPGPIKDQTPTEYWMVVGDYDGKADGKTSAPVAVDEAVARLQKAGITAFIFTSANHLVNDGKNYLGQPRWRVVAPLQKAIGPDDYLAHLAVLNGALGSCLASESGNLGQRWFYGKVATAPEYRHATIHGTPLDVVAAGETITPVPVKAAKPKTSTASAPVKPRTASDIARAISALRAIPNSGEKRLDYDAPRGWRDIAFALHDATSGADEALQALIEWTADGQVEKTTAIWSKIKRKPGGITAATLYEVARAAGWKEKPTAEGFEVIAGSTAPIDVVALKRRLFGAFAAGTQTDEDCSRFAALPGEAQEWVIEQLELLDGAAPKAARDALERGKAGARDLRLPIEAFPYTKKTAKDTLVPTNHSANYTVMLQRSGFALSYDVIEKEIKVFFNGQPLPKSDHEGEVLLRRATDLCVVNNLPIDGLQSTLTALVAGNPVNPVTDVLASLVWDGKARFDALAAAVGPGDLIAARAAFRIFFVQACAAADGAERGMRANASALPKYETVLVLQGEQGAGKTSGLRKLLPAPLRGYLQDGVTLAIGDKDSERQAVSAWISELGELEATFRRSDTERLKAFLSKREDRMRVAYGRADSRFQRRTVFVASANGEKVLTDLTGSRRFAVLSVTTMNLGWSDDEIAQVWAEAWHRYVRGEQWWPTREEEVVLRGAAERFESSSSIEERLCEKYDWERGMEGVRVVERVSMTKILDQLRPGMAREHSQAEMTQARETIRRLWRRHGAKLKHGELKVRVLDDWKSIYVSGGKNAGFLLPLERDSGGLSVERDALLYVNVG